MPDVLEVWLHGPSRNDLRHVGQLQIELVVPGVQRQATKCDLIHVEAADTVGEAGVDEARAKLVVRPPGHLSAEYDAPARVKIDEIAIRRGNRTYAEYRNAAVRGCACRTIELLVEHRIDAGIAAVFDRYPEAGRIGKR